PGAIHSGLDAGHGRAPAVCPGYRRRRLLHAGSAFALPLVAVVIDEAVYAGFHGPGELHLREEPGYLWRPGGAVVLPERRCPAARAFGFRPSAALRRIVGVGPAQGCDQQRRRPPRAARLAVDRDWSIPDWRPIHYKERPR